MSIYQAPYLFLLQEKSTIMQSLLYLFYALPKITIDLHSRNSGKKNQRDCKSQFEATTWISKWYIQTKA